VEGGGGRALMLDPVECHALDEGGKDRKRRRPLIAKNLI